MMTNKKIVDLIVLAVLFLMLTACGGTVSQDNGQQPQNTEQQGETPNVDVQKLIDTPTELIVTYAGGPYEPYFDERFGNQIRKKFPQYTFTYLDTSNVGEAVATNPTIDLLMTSIGGMNLFMLPYELQSDISDLIKKYNYDLAQLRPETIQGMKENSNGQIYGLPWTMASLGFFYNKNIFEKFGEDTPKQGITWDELYQLAIRMTRTDGDQPYTGLSMIFDQVVVWNSAGVKMFDETTNKPRFLENDVVRLFENAARFFKIDGYQWGSRNEFIVEQTNAMHLDNTGILQMVAEAMDNWDIASFPVFPEFADVDPAPGSEYAFIPSIAKHRDAAFQVLTYLTSNEYQTWMARELGFLPIRADSTEAMSQFGKNIPGVQGKNLQALVPRKAAEHQVFYRYLGEARSELPAALEQYLAGTDLNTALREAAERAEQTILEQIKMSSK